MHARTSKALIAAAIALVIFISATTPGKESRMSTTSPATYVGLWVTADNHLRQELLPTGRYVEARGTREAAYTGRYEITGDHIEYWDASGFQADGEFRDDVLYHGGMVMHRSTSRP
jgi:hypothetical protein